jgi:hypothetical protein
VKARPSSDRHAAASLVAPPRFVDAPTCASKKTKNRIEEERGKSK